MALGILQNTPYWVWGIFLLLLVLGLSQTRARKVSRVLVYVLPAIMIPLSLSAILGMFGAGPLPLTAWALGIVAAFVLNVFVFRAPSAVRYDRAQQKFEVGGSVVPSRAFRRRRHTRGEPLAHRYAGLHRHRQRGARAVQRFVRGARDENARGPARGLAQGRRDRLCVVAHHVEIRRRGAARFR